MKAKNFKIIAILISLCLIFEQSGFAQVAGQLDISSRIASLGSQFVQDKFRPLHLRCLVYDQALNNFQLLLDRGDVKGLSQQLVKDSTHDLLQYFLVGVTLPNDSFWVNLKPDAPDNVIEPFLAQTDVGRILLEADLQLKKDTAKATSPETVEGKKYWALLYKKAGELFGNENVTIPTLVRPWIVPDEIIIRESDANAYIYKATLKVMLEEDYLKSSAVYNFKDPRFKALNEYSAQLIRGGIIPKLNKEVNTAKRYASLRQVYYSLILAQWFKSRFTGKNNTYAALINRRNLTNLSSQESWTPRSYFEEYRKSFQEGEYNLKENIYTPYGQSIRTYTSGGINMAINMPAMGSKNNIVSSPAETRIIDIPSLSRILPLEGSPKNISVIVTEGNKIEVAKMQEPDVSVAQVSGFPIQQASSPVTKPTPSPQSNNIKNLMFQAIFTTGFGNGPVAGYKDDIALALKKGRISFISWVRDPLSVLDGIDLKDGKNARRLDEPAKRVYAALANSLPVANVQVLVLNPGAGGAIGGLLDISEGAQIDTVSLTPIASRIILKASIDDLRKWVSEYYLKTRNKDKLPDTGKLLKDGRISLTLAFELQRAGYPVFDIRPEQNPEPFIRHQYIGEFLNKNMRLPQYDFVDAFLFSADSKKLQATFNKARTLLRSGGVLNVSSDRTFSEEQMAGLIVPEELLVLYDEPGGKSFIVIRKGTQYAQQIESYLKNNEVRQLLKGAYAVPSLRDMPWERFAGSLSDWVANNAAFPSEAYKSVPIEKWETKARVDLKELPVGAMVLLDAAPARVSYLIRKEKEDTVSLWINGQDGYFSGSTDLLASLIPGERESQKGVIEVGQAVGLPYFNWEGGNLVRSNEPGRNWWMQSFSTTRVLTPESQKASNSPAGQNYQKGTLEFFTEKQRKDLIDRLRKGATEAGTPFDGNEIIKIGHEIIDAWQGTATMTEKFLGELGEIELLMQNNTLDTQNKLRPIVQDLKDYVEFSRQRGPFSSEGGFVSSPIQKKEEWSRHIIDNINGDPAKTAEFLDGLGSITDPQDEGFIRDLRLRAIEKSIMAANGLKAAQRRTNFPAAANKYESVNVVKEEGFRGNYIRVGRLIVINSKLIMPQEIRQRMQNDLVIEIAGSIDYLPYLVPMLDAMQNTDFRGKTVIDYGAGNGILGLAALRLGAKRVIAIDADSEGLVGGITKEGRVDAEYNFRNAGYTTAFVDKVTPEKLAQAKAQCILINTDLRDWFKNEGEYWQWISAGNEVIRLADLGYSYRVHTPLMLHLLSESAKTPVIIGGYIQDTSKNTPDNPLDMGMEEMSPEKGLKVENDNPLPHMLTEIFGKESSGQIISRLGIDKAWLGYQTDQFLFTFYNRIIGKKESINWKTDLGVFSDTNAKIYYALRATPQPIASSPVVDIQADNIDSKFMFFNEETKELSYGGVKLDFFKEGGSNLMYLLGDSIIRVAEEIHGPEILLPNYMRMGAEGFSPEVLASGFTGGGDKEGHFFVAVPRVYGESLMDLERLNTEQKAIFLEFFGRMIARGVYINDFNMKQFMYGSIKDGAKRMWLVDPEWAKTLTPQRALEWYSQVMDTYLEVLNESKDDPAIIEKERQFFLMVKEYLTKVDLQSLLKSSAGSSPILQETDDKGGIDFRSLPITTQPILPTLRGSALPFNPNLANINLDKEWAEIQKMLNAGITPSSERIKEYAQVCSQSQDADKELAKVVSCIADILRMEEEKCVPSEGALTDLLMVLESGKIASEIPAVLGAVNILPK